MKVKTAPLMAILLLTGYAAGLPAAWSQGLPPVNMGKTVKQPGDNQYMPQAQLDRHSDYVDRTGTNSSFFINRPAGGGGGGGGGGLIQVGGITINPMVLMYSTAPKVDVSLEPISTDEPVPPAGFPPLPDRIQLPVSLATSGSGNGGNGWNGNGGGGTGGGGGGNGNINQGVHEHYQHVTPGAYMPGGAPGSHGEGPGNGGGNGGGGGAGYVGDPNAAVPGFSGSPAGGGTARSGGSSTAGGGGGNAGGSGGGGVLPAHGYYKVGTVQSPSVNINTANGDTFNASTGAGGVAPPRYTGASSKDLKTMGPVPKLDDAQDANAGAPEAPQAAIVSQSQAQDLSLPDDEFVSRQGLQDSAGKRAAKRAAARTGQLLMQGVNAAASRAYSIVP